MLARLQGRSNAAHGEWSAGPPAGGRVRHRARTARAWRNAGNLPEVATTARQPGATGRHRGRHRQGHDVARRELGARVRVEGKPSARPVDQQAPARHGLGDERRRIDAGQGQGGWMELQELEVAGRGADVVRQAQPSAVATSGWSASHCAIRSISGSGSVRALVYRVTQPVTWRTTYPSGFPRSASPAAL